MTENDLQTDASRQEQLLIESMNSQVYLGEIDEGERICGDCKYCCAKRRCCTFAVALILMLDLALLFGIVENFFLVLDSFDKINRAATLKQDDRRRYAFSYFLGFWANDVVLFSKLYLGMRWLCKRTRNRFLTYYRMSATYFYSAFASLCIAFMLGLSYEVRLYRDMS